MNSETHDNIIIYNPINHVYNVSQIVNLEILIPVVKDVESQPDLLATAYWLRSFNSHEERSCRVMLRAHRHTHISSTSVQSVFFLELLPIGHGRLVPRTESLQILS